MQNVLRDRKYYSLKIFPITPYNSKILVPTRPELHCFHRPEGEGVGRPIKIRERPTTCWPTTDDQRLTFKYEASYMSSYPNRCQHIKVNGTQCGSPALRRNK